MILDHDLTDNNNKSNLKIIIPSLIKKLPNTLIKLNLDVGSHNFPLSFIINFKFLQELQLLFNIDENYIDFKDLQYVNFPQLQTLKIRNLYSKVNLLIKFLEINGRNLKELCLGDFAGYSDNSLNLVIAKFCTNLRKLSTGFKYDELETLKIVFNSCQYLENIKIWCGDPFLSEKKALEAFAKYSHENISELILYHLYNLQYELYSKELESFFISWTNRIPQKSFSLVIINYNNSTNSLEMNDENMKIIKKYTELGVIKKFQVTGDSEYLY